MAGNDTPAVHALHGDVGLCEAKDYRGVQSLAFIQPVADSPWFMVAKVDVSEILSEVHYRAAAIAVVVILSICLTAAMLLFTERRRAADALTLSAAQLHTQAAELLVANSTLISQVEKVKQQADELNRSNKDLEQFAAVASHDLQEPLRMVASYTQLLADRYEGQLDEKAGTYIAYAVDGAVRMQRLINDLLTYSRVGARGKPIESTDSHSILCETIGNLAAGTEESKVSNMLHVVGDGQEALAYLHRTGKYAGAPRPDLIWLDLNLPKKDGREVLAEIKADDDLKRIPVVILTSSQAEEDIVRSYNLHANCYIRKPVDLHQFLRVVKAIEEFWFTVVILPPGDSL